MINKQIKNIIAISFVIFLSNCATYKSSFNCPSAKGVYCASMDYVDQMINSGEIERFNEQRNKRKYRISEPVLATLKKDKEYEAVNASN